MKLYSFKEGLKRARKEAGFTQQGLADTLEVHIKTVMNWEQGKAEPSMETLTELTQLYNCDLDYLAGRINFKTHDMQFIHDYTGLSEAAIMQLYKWKNSDDRKQHWSEYISKIIENEKSSTLFGHISDLMGTAKLKGKFSGKGLSTEDFKDWYASSMWYLSHIFTNIIEQFYSESSESERK